MKKPSIQQSKKKVLFLLEEPSAEELLKVFIPRCFPAIQSRCQYLHFRGKDNLLKRLPDTIMNYANQCSKIIILCDQDNDDCIKLKRRIVASCKKTGFQSQCVVRIVCRELESWYLAQLDIVAKHFGTADLVKRQHRYKNPDSQNNPAAELKRMTNENYQKIKGSRMMGQYIEPDVVRSTSFKHFVAVLKQISK
ncbi:MAG: DUF4276 family protein [Planctomycetaceae bacterium]|jgi:hypothetical protein|nr:DUF4276 family protein [Planctomycetaceae bacterium]